MDKYKNETDKNIKIRTGNLKNYIWKTIRPGEKTKLPWHIAEPSNLTKVTEEKHSEGVSNEPQKKENQQAPGKLSKEEYKKELLAINGVGPKYAKEIIGDYPTVAKLKKAIAAEKEIHKHDGVNEAVREKFK